MAVSGSPTYRPTFIPLIAVALMSLAACQNPKTDPMPGDNIGIVLMHGKGGTTYRVESIGSDLERSGVLVEMPLMPWSADRIYDKGYEQSMVEIDTYVDRLRQAGAKRIFIAGHSIGANAALGYAARRKDLSGAILLDYGHVPGIPGFASRLAESVAEARSMIAAGKGDHTAIFNDLGGANNTAKSTALDILSWFDPDGPATIKNNAPKVSPNTPVLCIKSSSRYHGRCGMILRLLPKNAMNRVNTVNVGHLEAPSASFRHVANWLRDLN